MRFLWRFKYTKQTGNSEIILVIIPIKVPFQEHAGGKDILYAPVEDQPAAFQNQTA